MKRFIFLAFLLLFVSLTIAHQGERSPRVLGGGAPGAHVHDISDDTNLAVTAPITLTDDTIGINTIDISDDTNLTVTAPVTLTDDDISIADAFVLNSTFDTMLGDLTNNSADPTFILNGSTAGDTDYWFGITADEDSADNDILQFGKGIVTGTTPFFWFDKDGGFTSQNLVDSTTAIQILDVAGNPVFNVDTLSELVGIGKAAPTAVLHVASAATVVRIEDDNTDGNAQAFVDFNDLNSRMGMIGFNSPIDNNLDIKQDNASADIVFTFNGGENLTLNDDGSITATGALTANSFTGTNVTAGADPGHTHTGASVGGIDISDDTNLTVTAPITLTDDDVGITVAKDIVVAGTGMSGGEDNVLPGADADTTITLTVAKDIVVSGTGMSGGENDVLPGADADTTITLTTAKDIVAGGGLTGGEDNVLPGADADTTVAVGAGDHVIVNADEIEVYGLVASDGAPVNTVVADADGDVAFGLAAGSIETTSQYEFLIDATKNILIDGATNPRNMTLGLMRFLHIPTIDDTRAIHVAVDANGQADVHGMFVSLVGTGLAAGEAIQGLGVTLDSADSTGGFLDGIRVDIAGAGSAGAHAIHADPGVIPIHQEVGTFGTVEQAWDENGGFTDVTAAFNSTVTDVTIFSANADKIYVGDAADFNAIQVNLDTNASGAGVKPTFEYSIAGPGWTAFVPNDGTNGFRTSSDITWDETALTGWVAVSVNGVSKQYIRITRTQAGLATPPIEDTIQVSVSVEYEWNATGDLTVNDITTAGDVVRTPSTTQVINAVGDVVLADAALVILNPDADYILTSTPTIADGTTGQRLMITCVNGEANTVTLQDEALLATTNLSLKSGTTTVLGGKAIEFIFDGTEWVETGQQDIQSAQGTFIAPDLLNDELPLYKVDAEKYPRGVILMNVQITIPADAAYSMVFEEWAGDPPAAQADIETVTTGAGDSYMEVRTTDIDNRDLDADDSIFLDIPATDVAWIQCAAFFYAK